MARAFAPPDGSIALGEECELVSGVFLANSIRQILLRNLIHELALLCVQLHEIAEDVQLPFFPVISLIKGVHVVLPVVIEELVVARYVVIYVIVGHRIARHLERHRLMNVVAIVFHSDGLLFSQGEVGSGAPVEVVVVAVLAVEGGGGDVGGGVSVHLAAAYVIRGDVLLFPFPLPVGIAKLAVVGYFAVGVGEVEVVVVAHEGVEEEAGVLHDGEPLQVLLGGDEQHAAHVVAVFGSGMMNHLHLFYLCNGQVFYHAVILYLSLVDVDFGCAADKCLRFAILILEHSGKFGKHFCSSWLLLERSSRDASHDSTILLAELRAGSLDGYGCELFLPLDAVLAQFLLHRLDAISRNALCCSSLCLLSVCHHRISQDEQAAHNQFMFHNLLSYFNANMPQSSCECYCAGILRMMLQNYG